MDWFKKLFAKNNEKYKQQKNNQKNNPGKSLMELTKEKNKEPEVYKQSIDSTDLNLIENLTEILKSPPVNHIDYLKIEQWRDLKEKFIHFIDKIDIYEDEYTLFNHINTTYEKWERIIKRPWLKDKSVIALVGKFSAGKSSIMNSILGKKILPVDIAPTTALPTYISYTPRSEILSCKIEDYDGEIKEISLKRPLQNRGF